MLQVELRVNGILIDYIDITNIVDASTLLAIEAMQQKPPVAKPPSRYKVQHGQNYTALDHHREDGALALAAKALTAIVEKEL